MISQLTPAEDHFQVSSEPKRLSWRRVLVALSVPVVMLLAAGCASNPAVRQQVREIHTASINYNVDFRGSLAPEGAQARQIQEVLVNEFVHQLDQSHIFSRPVVMVKASLETWREEGREMKYDGFFKLTVRSGAKEGTWMVEALLESRSGNMVWRSARPVPGGTGGPDISSIGSVCEKLVRDFRRARG